MENLGLSFWLAVVTLLLTLLAAIELFTGNRSVEALRDMPLVPVAKPKLVSIIVAARNEQRNIRSALQSLLDLEYPDYELIVVDDRACQSVCINGFFGLLHNRHSVIKIMLN